MPRANGCVFRSGGVDLWIYWYYYPFDFDRDVVNRFKGVIPIALWGILKWFGSESANLLECWALYGYANLIWIPVALVSWSPITSELATSGHYDSAEANNRQFSTGCSSVLVLESLYCSWSATCLFPRLHPLRILAVRSSNSSLGT